jgi:hypothetical protein
MPLASSTFVLWTFEYLLRINGEHGRHNGAIGEYQRCNDGTCLSTSGDIDHIEGCRANQAPR